MRNMEAGINFVGAIDMLAQNPESGAVIDGSKRWEVIKLHPGKDEKPIYLAIDHSQCLGRGSFGAVFKAYRINSNNDSPQRGHIDPNQAVAVKVVDKEKFNDDEYQIQKEYIPTTKPVSINEKVYLTMPCLGLNNLQESERVSKLTFEQRVELAFRLVLKFNRMHHDSQFSRGEHAHYDIKPQNILLGMLENGTLDIFPIDFGLSDSRSYSDSDSEEEEQKKIEFKGSAGYMAPELLKIEVVTGQLNTTEIDMIKTDIFSLASPIMKIFGALNPQRSSFLAFKDINIEVFQNLLTMTHRSTFNQEGLFEGYSTPNYQIDVRRILENFINKMMVPEPTERPSSDAVLRFFTSLNNFCKAHKKERTEAYTQKQKHQEKRLHIAYMLLTQLGIDPNDHAVDLRYNPLTCLAIVTYSVTRAGGLTKELAENLLSDSLVPVAKFVLKEIDCLSEIINTALEGDKKEIIAKAINLLYEKEFFTKELITELKSMTQDKLQKFIEALSHDDFCEAIVAYNPRPQLLESWFVDSSLNKWTQELLSKLPVSMRTKIQSTIQYYAMFNLDDDSNLANFKEAHRLSTEGLTPNQANNIVQKTWQQQAVEKLPPKGCNALIELHPELNEGKLEEAWNFTKMQIINYNSGQITACLKAKSELAIDALNPEQWGLWRKLRMAWNQGTFSPKSPVGKINSRQWVEVILAAEPERQTELLTLFLQSEYSAQLSAEHYVKLLCSKQLMNDRDQICNTANKLSQEIIDYLEVADVTRQKLIEAFGNKDTLTAALPFLKDTFISPSRRAAHQGLSKEAPPQFGRVFSGGASFYQSAPNRCNEAPGRLEGNDENALKNGRQPLRPQFNYKYSQ